MQSLRKTEIDSDFRRIFAEFDDSTLISPRQWATLCGQTLDSVYTANSRGILPTPAIQKNRLIRWTAGQYRAWAKSLTDAAPAHRRGGRPRKAVHQSTGGEA